VSGVGSRWGSHAPGGAQQARERLLDAAEACFARYGVGKTTVEDMARTAAVSRATVYRYFEGGRDEIILGVVLRETDRYLAAVEPRIASQPSLSDAMVDFVAHTVHRARAEERLGRLFTMTEAGTASRLVAEGSATIFARNAAFWEPLLDRWADQVRPGLDARTVSEHLLRVVLSQLTVDAFGPREGPELREYVRRYVVPALCCGEWAAG
jgi:AcrR family transcriptional regulator